MTFSRDELHVITVALMISIDQIGRATDYKDGLEVRDEYLPKLRALLDRFSN